MNEQTTSQRTIAPPSPLSPYRKTIKENPIEDHFTNKRLRKHMRHHGLIPQTPTKENKEPTSLEHDEHRIYNSGSQKYKRFRQKFLLAMADTVQEVDRARQAEFRNQLELWDKIYSNRIQRIQENDTTLQRKYALFMDKQIKKQLIQENLPKMPELPSLSMPQILPDFVRKRSKRRARSAKENLPSDISHHQHLNKEHSYHHEIDERLTQLENRFSQFQRQDFGDHSMNFNLLNMDGQLLTNDNNIIQDQFNKFNQQIQQLKTELKDSIKDQQIFKIIQSQQEQNISQLTLLVKTLYEQLKTISTNKNEDEDLNNIQDKQQQFNDSLQTIFNNMETIGRPFITTDNGINQINNNIIGQQQQQIQNGINHNLNELEQKLTTLQKQFEKTIHQTIKNIQTETTILKGKVDALERNIHQINLSHTNKRNTLPFVEKLPPMDLLEINWDKYHQQNQID